VRALVPPDPPLGDAELLLRLSTERDVAAIRAVYSEPDIRHWMGWHGELPDEAEAFANIERAASAWRAGTWAVFRIVDRATDEVVGGVNLRFCEHQIAEISYFLRASARGRGLATRSVRLVARWAFEEFGIARIELRVHPDNLASRRVAERAGFAREGIERCSRAWPDETRFDSLLFSLIARDSLDEIP
jgi:RimJ/RimL family protein N-acetyltransferase